MTTVLTLLVLLVVVGAILYDYWYNILPEHKEQFWTDETLEQLEVRGNRMRQNIQKERRK